MVNVSIEGGKAVFEVEGWDRLWALRSRLEVPLEHIKDAHRDPDPPMGWFQGLKLVGTDLPNVFRAGTFRQQGALVFWDVLHAEKAIVVELHDERYARLFLEVNDPDATVDLLNEALAGAR